MARVPDGVNLAPIVADSGWDLSFAVEPDPSNVIVAQTYCRATGETREQALEADLVNFHPKWRETVLRRMNTREMDAETPLTLVPYRKAS